MRITTRAHTKQHDAHCREMTTRSERRASKIVLGSLDLTARSKQRIHVRNSHRKRANSSQEATLGRPRLQSNTTPEAPSFLRSVQLGAPIGHKKGRAKQHKSLPRVSIISIIASLRHRLWTTLQKLGTGKESPFFYFLFSFFCWHNKNTHTPLITGLTQALRTPVFFPFKPLTRPR